MLHNFTPHCHRAVNISLSLTICHPPDHSRKNYRMHWLCISMISSSNLSKIFLANLIFRFCLYHRPLKGDFVVIFYFYHDLLSWVLPVISDRHPLAHQIRRVIVSVSGCSLLRWPSRECLTCSFHFIPFHFIPFRLNLFSSLAMKELHAIQFPASSVLVRCMSFCDFCFSLLIVAIVTMGMMSFPCLLLLANERGFCFIFIFWLINRLFIFSKSSSNWEGNVRDARWSGWGYPCYKCSKKVRCLPFFIFSSLLIWC